MCPTDMKRCCCCNADYRQSEKPLKMAPSIRFIVPFSLKIVLKAGCCCHVLMTYAHAAI